MLPVYSENILLSLMVRATATAASPDNKYSINAARKAVQIIVAEGVALESAKYFKALMEAEFGVEVALCSVGPVIGVHTGPGTIGAAVVFE